MAELTIPEALRQATRHQQAGRLPQAEALCRGVLAADPTSVDALRLLGVIARQAGRTDVTPIIHYNLGVALTAHGRSGEAIAAFQRAIELRPDYADAHNNLGNLLQARGQTREALASFQRAVEFKPDFAEAHNNLGTVLLAEGRLDDAARSLERAVTLKPDFAIAHYNLGNLFRQRSQFEPALACYRRALALHPGFAEAHDNLGNLFADQHRFDEAIACYQQALALNPNFAEAHSNLGSALLAVGRLEEALACVRRTLALMPDRADIRSSLISSLHYQPGLEPAAMEAERRHWNERHVRPLGPRVIPHPNDRSPDRRLRIGYVSPDLRAHPVGLNLLPLFQNHAHDRCEVFCYADVPRPDQVTARLRACSDHWRDSARLSDAALADAVREDRIDVLVDLALHTTKNRLMALARKPAPVQVSFAGYPGGTGMDRIDYHLTDPYLEPAASSGAQGPDAPFCLPETFWCYDPQADDEDVNPLPALADGPVTFGCLNSFCKVNEPVLQLWARVLQALSDSRLLLLTAGESHRQRTLAILGKAGIGSDRIEFVDRRPRKEYLALYHRIDVGLDTFPYNGHTTSLDSYWMGVPIITLVGSTVVGRGGWSQLSNLGLVELAAHSADEFVSIATELARDLPRLARLRATLRERMRRSPLMDGPRFARHVEAAYREMWRRWCAQADAARAP